MHMYMCGNIFTIIPLERAVFKGVGVVRAAPARNLRSKNIVRAFSAWKTAHVFITAINPPLLSEENTIINFAPGINRGCADN